MIARFAAVAVSVWLCSLGGAFAQQSLADLVDEARAGWMFGQWESPMDDVKLNISWDLDKKVVVMHIKTSEMESKGYTALDPASGTAVYYSFDNRGSLGKGSWDMESDELTLRVELQVPDRNPWKVGFVFGGSASSGLEIRMLGGEGRTYRFKKATAPAPAKK